MKQGCFDKAIRSLEFDKITALLADCAQTEGGKGLALTLFPDTDLVRIRKKLGQTSDAKALSTLKGPPSFGGVKDVSGSLERAEKGAPLNNRELLDVALVLRTARRLISYFNEGHRDPTIGKTLSETFSRLEPERGLEEKITRIILAEDLIADEASPALSDIRRKIRAANNKIKDVLQKYVNGSHSKVLQENIITMRGGRYVIPVKAEYKNEIKGLVHDTSASGATLFIEPMAVVDANNELRTLESEEKHEIERILAELSAECAASSYNILNDYHAEVELDFIFAKAALSDRMAGMEPTLNEKKLIRLHAARHPLIDKDKIVPISPILGGAYDTMVITGPNTGGKTVTLKTLGLLSLMAQAGLHIPCDGDTTLCVFDGIMADIGDEQSIEQSLSTFSAHMTNIVKILDQTGENSLVLFDELCSGTDPTEGAALAISIIEKIREKGALCCATTHYAEIKVYALEHDGVVNASCEFDVETLKPTYRLIVGTPGKSNAFAISEKLGLDPAIVEAARTRISADDKRFETVIEQLEKSRIEMEKERDEAARLRKEYETFKKTAEDNLRSRLASAEKDLEKTQAKATQMMESARITSEFVLEELEKVKKQKESERFAAELEEARGKIRKRLKETGDIVNPVEEGTDEDYVLPRPLKPGDEVQLINVGTKGIVDTAPDKQGNVTVRTGMIKTRTNVKNLKLLTDAVTVTAEKQKKSANAYRALVSREFSPSLDLRGQTGDDAWFMTDKYLDEAKVAGVLSVTIIHGKGTGALRTAIQTRLKHDPRVKGFRNGMYGEGDAGVTIVELK